MDDVLFPEDQKKIEEAVIYYPMGSHQIGEIAKMSALLYGLGIDVKKQLKLLCEKYNIDVNKSLIK